MGLAELSQEAVSIECGECGIAFSVPKHWRQTKMDSGSSFYCPNGHCRAYAESTVQKLQKQLVAEQQRRQWADRNAEEARQERDKEQAKRRRLEKRVKAGTCPFCKRSFVQLRRHMACRHPEQKETP